MFEKKMEEFFLGYKLVFRASCFGLFWYISVSPLYSLLGFRPKTVILVKDSFFRVKMMVILQPYSMLRYLANPISMPVILKSFKLQNLENETLVFFDK